MEESSNHTSSGHTERVTNGDGTSVDVDLVPAETKLLDTVSGLRGEGFVDLKEINVLKLETGLLDGGGDGNSGSDSHDSGVDTNNGGGAEDSHHLESKLLGDRTAHSEDNSSTITDLTGVSSSGASILLEDSTELSETLDGGSGTASLIVGNNVLVFLTLLVLEGDLNGDNLILEAAGLDGLGSTSVRHGSKLILFRTGDVVLGGNILRGDTHGDKTSLGLLVLHDLGVDGTLPLELGSGHVLDTTSETDVVETSLDVGSDVGEGLKSRRALAVHNMHRDSLGNTGHERGNTALVGALGTSSKDVSDDDIINDGSVNASLLNGGLENRGKHILDVGLSERTLASTANGGTKGRHNHNIIGTRRAGDVLGSNHRGILVSGKVSEELVGTVLGRHGYVKCVFGGG